MGTKMDKQEQIASGTYERARQERKNLHKHLAHAQHSLNESLLCLARLGSKEAFDEELGMVLAGPLGQHLRESFRLLVIARGLTPGETDGRIDDVLARESVLSALHGSYLD